MTVLKLVLCNFEIYIAKISREARPGDVLIGE